MPAIGKQLVNHVPFAKVLVRCYVVKDKAYFELPRKRLAEKFIVLDLLFLKIDNSLEGALALFVDSVDLAARPKTLGPIPLRVGGSDPGGVPWKIAQLGQSSSCPALATLATGNGEHRRAAVRRVKFERRGVENANLFFFFHGVFRERRCATTSLFIRFATLLAVKAFHNGLIVRGIDKTACRVTESHHGGLLVILANGLCAHEVNGASPEPASPTLANGPPALKGLVREIHAGAYAHSERSRCRCGKPCH